LINLLLLQAAIAHVAHSPVGAKGTCGSPLTPPFKYGQGVKGDSMSPRSNPTKVAVNFQFNQTGMAQR